MVTGLVLPLLALLRPLDLQAAPEVPFDVRFQTDDNGAIALFGNNLLTCPAADRRCADARAGRNSVNNNEFVMRMLDDDDNSSTFNSSSSVVQLPDAATLLWAGLYWGARLGRGDGGAAATTPANQMRLRAPGGGYQLVTSDAAFGPTAGEKAYQEFANVTDVVQQAGAGEYWGADVAAATGKDRYAGWSLVVVFRDPSLPLRNLTVFDGFEDVGRDNPQTITLSGFRTPVAGPVETQVGLVGYEGDRGSGGDQALLDGTQLSTPLSPGTNFFNSSNERDGGFVATRTPADRSMLGYDIKSFGASGIANNATSATFELSSTAERYFPGVVTTAIGLYAPDFSTSTKTVTNLAGRDPAEPGDVLEYSVTFNNTGQDPAAASVSTDPIPAGTRYVPGSLRIVSGPNAGSKSDGAGNDQAEYLPGADAVRFRLGAGASGSEGGTIGTGETTTFVFHVEVLRAAAGGPVVNTASLDYRAVTLGRPFNYTVPPARIPVRALADLSISKTSGPDPAAAGGILTSTLTVANSGPNEAVNVVVTDRLPPGVAFVGATPADACSESNGLVRCELGRVPDGENVDVVVRVRVPATSSVPSLVNTAAVESPTADPDPGDNADGSSVAVVRRADLAVSKIIEDTQLRPGQRTTVQVRVTNDGPSNAQSVVVSDEIDDPGLTVLTADLPGATCSADGDVARCTLPTLPAGESRTMTLTVEVSSDVDVGVSLDDTATVESSTADPAPGNNTDTATITTLPPRADLAVDKVSEDIFFAGGPVLYEILVTNQGPSDAQNVTFEDVLPAGVTVSEISTTRGSCSGVTTVTCQLGDMPGPSAGEVTIAEITITALIPADQPIGPLTNLATVDSDTPDPNGADNADEVIDEVQTRADLGVTKTAVPVQPSAGENVVYTITVSNSGPSTGRSVTVTDDLPDEFTLVEVSAPPGVSCTADDPLTCTLGDLAVGAERVVTITMNVPSDQGLAAGIPNTAVVDGDGVDPAEDDNEATATVTTSAVSDLILLKRISDPAGDQPLVAGEEVTYQVAVGNFGPSDASSARVVDRLPDGVTFVQSVPECSHQPADNTVVCNLPNVPNQFAAVFPVTVRVDEDLAARTLLTNTATVTLTDPSRIDPDTSNNVDSVSRVTTSQADIEVEKDSFFFDLPEGTFGQPAATPPGGIVSFAVSIRNDGPSIAKDVVVTDTLTLSDFGLGQVRLVRSDGSVEDLTSACINAGKELQCPIGDLPVFGPGDPSWLVQIDGVVLSDERPGSYVNIAMARSQTPELTIGNNTDDAPVTVLPPIATLQVEKSSLEGETLVAGGAFSYQLQVDNILDLQREGASDAEDVVLTDDIPAGLTATTVSATQGECTIAGQQVRCELGTVLGPGRAVPPPPVLVTISGVVASDATGSLRNTVDVTSPISEPARDDLTLPVEQRADIAIIKQADSQSSPAGGSVGYTITVTNAGPSDATDVVVEDALPSELDVVAEETGPGCDTQATPVTCTIDAVPAGESRIIRVVGTLDPDLPEGSITNTASIQERPDDPNRDNDTSSVETQVGREANLSVVKQASVESAPVGSTVSYSLTVSNAGPSTAIAVQLVDETPRGVTVQSVTADDLLTCTADGGSVTCLADSLPPGLSTTATVELLIDENLSPGDLGNTARVSSDTTDPDDRDNSSSSVISVFILADTLIEKSIVTLDPAPGRPVTFALDVINNGPQSAPSVVIADGLPRGLDFLSARVVGGEDCSRTRPENIEIITCLVGRLAVGESARALVRVRPDVGLRSLRNVAAVGSEALDAQSGDNVDEIVAQLEPPSTSPPTTSPPPSSPPPSGSPTEPGEPGAPGGPGQPGGPGGAGQPGGPTGSGGSTPGVTSATNGGYPNHPTAAPPPVTGSDPGSGELAGTGAPEVLPWLMAGLALIVSGGLLLAWTRRAGR